MIAVEGKSMRGAGTSGTRPHLLAALTHQPGVVLGQRAVPDKTSEIPARKDLLTPMDLAGTLMNGNTAVQNGHGRRVRRTVKAVQVPDWVN